MGMTPAVSLPRVRCATLGCGVQPLRGTEGEKDSTAAGDVHHPTLNHSPGAGWYNGNMIVSSSRGASVTFLGAAQTVSGSMHLVEAGGERILLDCGTARLGKRRGRSDIDFPFTPSSLDAVVLSH